MARKLRIEYPGACYHVINRGNFRQEIFNQPGAAQSFEKVLFETIQKFNWKLSAYVIMSNHFHLAIQVNESNLSLGMKWLQGTWVMRNNLFLKRIGRPFQGRYKAILLEPGVLNKVVSYIHLNPRRANLEQKGTIGSYRWSSLYWFSKRKKRSSNLFPEEALSSFIGLTDTASGWKKYLQFLDILAEDQSGQQELGFSELSKGWCKGGKAFIKETLKDVKEKKAALERARQEGVRLNEVQELRETVWEEILQEHAHNLKINLNELGSKKSSLNKLKLAYVMKQKSDVTNLWLTTQMDMGHPATVSQSVKRFSQAQGKEVEKLNAYLSKSKM